MQKYIQKFLITTLLGASFIGSTFASTSTVDVAKFDITVGTNNIITIKPLDTQGNIVQNYNNAIFIETPEIDDLSLVSLPSDGIYSFSIVDKGIYTGRPICFKEKNKKYTILVSDIENEQISGYIDFTNTMDYDECIKKIPDEKTLTQNHIIKTPLIDILQFKSRKASVQQLMSTTDLDKQAEILYRVFYLMNSYLPFINDNLDNAKLLNTEYYFRAWLGKEYLGDKLSDIYVINLCRDPYGEANSLRTGDTDSCNQIKQAGELGRKMYEYGNIYNQKIVTCIKDIDKNHTITDDFPTIYCYKKVYNITN